MGNIATIGGGGGDEIVNGDETVGGRGLALLVSTGMGED